MATWGELCAAAPDIAEVGLALLNQHGLLYLATVRRDDGPHLDPVTPLIADRRLFVALEPQSVRVHDLRADPRYVLHAPPGPDDAEFSVRGLAEERTGEAVRALVAAEALEALAPHHTVFEFAIDRAESAWWQVAGQGTATTVRRSWSADGGVGG